MWAEASVAVSVVQTAAPGRSFKDIASTEEITMTGGASLASRPRTTARESIAGALPVLTGAGSLPRPACLSALTQFSRTLFSNLLIAFQCTSKLKRRRPKTSSSPMN